MLIAPINAETLLRSSETEKRRKNDLATGWRKQIPLQAYITVLERLFVRQLADTPTSAKTAYNGVMCTVGAIKLLGMKPTTT